METIEKILIILLLVFVIMMVIFALIVFTSIFVNLIRAAYIPPASVYPYSVGIQISGGVVFCKIFDAEKRIAYVCARGNPDFLGFVVDEYHLAPLDNWVKR